MLTLLILASVLASDLPVAPPPRAVPVGGGAHAAFVARFDPNWADVPDHPVWNWFRQHAGTDAAARGLFVEIIRDEAAFQRLRRVVADPTVALAEYRDALSAIAERSRSRNGREPLVLTGELSLLLLLGSYLTDPPPGDVADRERQLVTYRVMTRMYGLRPFAPGQPAAANLAPELDPAIDRLFAAWVDARRDPHLAARIFDSVLTTRYSGAVPAARKWASDPKAAPRARAAALRVLGMFGDATTDMPIFQALFEDTTLVAARQLPTTPAVVLATQLQDVAVGMALVRLGERPVDFGFFGNPLESKEIPDPFGPLSLGFTRDADRARALAATTATLTAKDAPAKAAARVTRELLAFPRADRLREMQAVSDRRFAQGLDRQIAEMTQRLAAPPAGNPRNRQAEEQFLERQKQVRAELQARLDDPERPAKAAAALRGEVVERLTAIGPDALPALRDAERDADARVAGAAKAAIAALAKK